MSAHRNSCALVLMITLCGLAAGRPPRPLPNPANALPGLSQTQIQAFLNGQDAFQDVEEAGDGLGPIFNGKSCAECHPNGGGSTRISNIIGDGTTQWQMGGPVIQLFAITGYEPEEVPATVTVGRRRAMTTLGLGLIGAVADQDILNEQANQHLTTPWSAGVANIVTDAVTGEQRVGRIGQKSQHPNSTSFAAEAYLREMGITTPFFPHEEAPYNNPASLVNNPLPGINDDGEDVLAFGTYMDLLAPPHASPVPKQKLASVARGSQTFVAIGCASCHRPTWTTAAVNGNPALSLKTFSPYSDFLLHDLGQNGDQIPQGTNASGQPIPGSWMRTTPLWGVSTNTKFWHDASVDTIAGAVGLHGGQGAGSKNLYNLLPPPAKQDLINFLSSL